MAMDAKARETIFALRKQIAGLEGKSLPKFIAPELAESDASGGQHNECKDNSRLPFGIEAIDKSLDGGLPLDGMTEVRTAAMGNAGAATGFLCALVSFLKAEGRMTGPVLWIGDALSCCEAGVPYAPGLRQFGLAPSDILYASPHKLADTLWIAETAATSGVLGATILEIKGNLKHFGLAESRRLSLRAKASGRPLFLLRHCGEEEASSALFRFRLEPAPASLRRLSNGSDLVGSIGHPVFHVTLEKSRHHAPFSFLLEWNSHDRRFYPYRAAETLFKRLPAHSGARLSASADGQDRSSSLGHVVAFEKAS